MSIKTICMPSKFVMGVNAIEQLGTYLKNYGNKGILVSSPEDTARVADKLAKAVEEGCELVKAGFGGECSSAEIDRILAIANGAKPQAVIGLGGGKAIDTAKVVALKSGLPMIIVPTIAATDAVCSSTAILYNEEHELQGAVRILRNPEVVLADSDVIAKAPVRFLRSGIGDAYATYFEAKSCANCGAGNLVGGKSTYTAFSLSETCLDILLKYGVEAIEACRKKEVSEALENVIEANMLLSGIGFESAGLAVAHGIHDALTSVPDTHAATHGEKVAIGVLVQHIMDNDFEQLGKTVSFFRQVGLPTSYEEIGIKDGLEEKLRVVCAFALARPTGFVRHVCFEVTEEKLYSALMQVKSLDF